MVKINQPPPSYSPERGHDGYDQPTSFILFPMQGRNGNLSENNSFLDDAHGAIK
ncbi:MAG: hypothetical protein WAX07_10795 [Candidatus Altiarchaeia archaeon]